MQDTHVLFTPSQQPEKITYLTYLTDYMEFAKMPRSPTYHCAGLYRIVPDYIQEITQPAYLLFFYLASC